MIRRYGLHLSYLRSIVPQPRSPVMTVEANKADKTISEIGQTRITSNKNTPQKPDDSKEETPPIYGAASEKEFDHTLETVLQQISTAARGRQP